VGKKRDIHRFDECPFVSLRRQSGEKTLQELFLARMSGRGRRIEESIHFSRRCLDLHGAQEGSRSRRA
jgi:hypothetical protein